MKNVVGSLIPYFKPERIQERKIKKENMKKNFEWFWEQFDTMSFEDKKSILENVETVMEEVAIDFDLKDKEKEKKFKKMVRFFETLPIKKLHRLHDRLKEKINTQERLHSALLLDTEPEDVPEDENGHKFGIGSEEK